VEQEEPKLILVQFFILTKIYPETHQVLVQLHLPAEALAEPFKEDHLVLIMEFQEVAEAEAPSEVVVLVEKEMYLQYPRFKDMMVVVDIMLLIVTQEVAEVELDKLELMHL
jgi:hypothetical protein